jgi:eukaryotic-like serine/threonine-protein kinase
VVAEAGELFLVMEYVRGETLAKLLRAALSREEHVPVSIALSIMCGALSGLHAAHETLDEAGEPLGIIHRDVSPQNILVGEDGTTKIADFGIAKAKMRLHTTEGGVVKGKLGYFSPEQLRQRDGVTVDRRTDIFTSATVLWEILAGEKLFRGKLALETMTNILSAPVPPLTAIRQDVTPALDDIVHRALSRDPAERQQTAAQFAQELEECSDTAIASPRAVGAWVKSLAGQVLQNRLNRLREIESQEATPSESSSQEFTPPLDRTKAPSDPGAPVSTRSGQQSAPSLPRVVVASDAVVSARPGQHSAPSLPHIVVASDAVVSARPGQHSAPSLPHIVVASDAVVSARSGQHSAPSLPQGVAASATSVESDRTGPASRRSRPDALAVESVPIVVGVADEGRGASPQGDAQSAVPQPAGDVARAAPGISAPLVAGARGGWSDASQPQDRPPGISAHDRLPTAPADALELSVPSMPPDRPDVRPIVIAVGIGAAVAIGVVALTLAVIIRAQRSPGELSAAATAVSSAPSQPRSTPAVQAGPPSERSSTAAAPSTSGLAQGSEIAAGEDSGSAPSIAASSATDKESAAHPASSSPSGTSTAKQRSRFDPNEI